MDTPASTPGPPAADAPEPIPPRPRRPRRRLSAAQRWLYFTLFCAVLGAILWLASPGGAPSGLSAWAWLLAALALAGALVLGRLPAAGMTLLLAAGLMGLAQGSVWLLPAALAGAAWALHASPRARRLLGFYLLIPGIAAVHMGVMAVLSYVSRQPLPGLPDRLNPPLALGAALQPLWLLPLALAGAWLLTGRNRSN